MNGSPTRNNKILPTNLILDTESEPPDRSEITAYLETSNQVGYRSSHFTILSALAGWYYGVKDCAVLASLVVLTSRLYWKNPIPGWRRNLDITVVNGSLFYQTWKYYRYLSTRQRRWYTFSIGCTLAHYLTARYYGQSLSTYAISCRCHQGVHFWGNLANILLYRSVSRSLCLGWSKR